MNNLPSKEPTAGCVGGRSHPPYTSLRKGIYIHMIHIEAPSSTTRGRNSSTNHRGFVFGTSDLIDEEGDAGGYCVITDGDSDKAFLEWHGTIDPATGFNGDYHWTGGTGKYTGMTGENTLSAGIVGATPEGRGILSGEWRLP
jgi:hypothetical protein